MTTTTLERYASLLVHYCLELKPGDQVYVNTTLLAEPLVREVYREIIKAGANAEIKFSMRGANKIYFDHANDAQLAYLSPISDKVIREFDAYLSIRAPYNLREDSSIDPAKRKRRALASQPLNQVFSERTAAGDLTRSLCQYPTDASAQEAGMSLEEYTTFVFGACYLHEEDPSAAWRKVRTQQQHYVDILNTKETIRYRNERTDISFSVAGRTWINSDGRVNMPSGEVFSGPVEESVNGVVHFDYPSIYMGREVSGVTLHVEQGHIKSWTAERGQDVLDEVMAIKGARYFGEVAIGTNYQIQQPTKNILFDEKIGGTIHMAVGQSYIQTGGRNESPIHWDLIADMTASGEIWADDELIYERGRFVI
ncbi:MAG: aminopeptidase [Bacteroidota bacterium]